jgi:hypothetical protein
MVKSHTSSSVLTASSSRLSMTPALLNSTCSAPKASSARRTIASQSAARDTSACWNTAAPPAPRMSFSVRWPASSSMSTTTTRAASAANSSADSRPIPLPAPVIRATLSFKRICSRLLGAQGGTCGHMIWPSRHGLCLARWRRRRHQCIEQPLLCGIPVRGQFRVPLHRDQFRVPCQLHPLDGLVRGKRDGREARGQSAYTLVVP